MHEMVFETEKQKAEEHALNVKQKQELYKIKHKNDVAKPKLSFSKVAFIFMIANCSVIELYALITMFIFADLSPLSTLIAAVVGECVTFLGYEIKSVKENISGGIVYESTMKKLEYELENNNDEDDAVG